MVTLRFMENDHKRLVAKKGKLTWEKFVMIKCLEDNKEEKE